MEILTKDYDIGIVVARFQVHRLHLAHTELMEHLGKNHKKTILFLGTCVPIGTRENPLNFMDRKHMVQEKYPDVMIMPLPDINGDVAWSEVLDKKIREVYPQGSAVIYGSRDSFAEHYHGKNDVCRLEPVKSYSGTQIREEIGGDYCKSTAERAGKIMLAFEMYPKTHPCIDALITRYVNGEREILLGKKEFENEFRVIGGLIDPTDANAEAAVTREVMEETGVEIGDIKYLASTLIDDHRYRNIANEKIMTFVYVCTYVFGAPKAADDIVDVKWFSLNEKLLDNVINGHKKLIKLLL